jgi:Ala-tRNA(Pro) deacylase
MAIAARIEAVLRKHGTSYELIPHPVTGSTHESALAAHVADDHIAKGVVVRDREGDALAVIPGNAWLDMDALNRETARAFELEDEGDLSRLFPDCAKGAVPALGAAYGLETFLDEALTSLANVYFEAGDHRHLLRVSGDAFAELLAGARRGHFSGLS